MEEIYKQILKKFKEELDTDKNADFIEVLFQERKDTLYQSIIQNEEYKNLLTDYNSNSKSIKTNFENGDEIVNAIEECEDNLSQMQVLSEKLMYEYGLCDGIRLMMAILKKQKEDCNNE